MSSSSDVRRSLRRLRAVERVAVACRQRSALPFIDELTTIPKLMLDTTVYIDELQGKLPRDAELALRSTQIWHSTVTECELAALPGLLSPDHRGTAQAVDQVMESIERRPSHRILNPDRQVWRDAGMLAGLLTRMQRRSKSEQRRILNDALILLSAAKAGLTVLTRNIADFDLLMQLAPQGSALFYEAMA